MKPAGRKRIVAAALAALAGAAALGLPALSAKAAAGDPWWAGGGAFRAPITVTFPGTSGQAVPVETTVDFNSLLTAAGGTGTVDTATVRVVEVSGNNPTGPSLPVQVDDDNGTKKLVFLAPATSAGAHRYDVYFDKAGASVPTQSAATPITLSSADDAGQDSYKIATTAGTWYFQKQGGAFSSFDDASGADWIGYENNASSNRRFRGTPNLNDDWYHPGGTQATTTLLSSGPVKVVIKADGGGNSTIHEIYPGFVRSTLTAAPVPYWWLYEGTPGGGIVGGESVLKPSGGTVATLPLSANVEGDISSLGDAGAAEWIAFTNGTGATVGRSIFFAHQDEDNPTDGSLAAGAGADSMAVFGFGRSPAADYPQLSGNNTFTMGLVDTKDGGVVRNAVIGATAAPAVFVGAAEAGTAGGGGSTTTTAPPVSTGTGAKYTAVTPSRVLDTRSGNKLGPLEPVRVVVRGVADVPASATSIVLNATVVEPTQPTFVAVYPSDIGFPGISNLNSEVNDTVPNLVTSPIGIDGGVFVLNGAGTAHVLLDVVGYYAPTAAVPTGGGLHAMSPVRWADTRAGAPLGAGEARTFSFAGVPGVVAGKLKAVALNVTSTGSTTGGYLTVYPAGAARPLASNLNFTAQQTVPNAVITGVDGAGNAVVYNPQGSTDVILDVVGWYDDGTVDTGLGYHEVAPTRVLDTRSGAPIGEGAERVWARTAPIPASAKAVAVNATVTQATGLGYFSVFPGAPRPGVSTQNTSPGLTRANHVLTALGGWGQLTAYNSTGTAHLVYDVFGYFD